MFATLIEKINKFNVRTCTSFTGFFEKNWNYENDWTKIEFLQGMSKYKEHAKSMSSAETMDCFNFCDDVDENERVVLNILQFNKQIKYTFQSDGNPDTMNYINFNTSHDFNTLVSVLKGCTQSCNETYILNVLVRLVTNGSLINKLSSYLLMTETKAAKELTNDMYNRFDGIQSTLVTTLTTFNGNSDAVSSQIENCLFRTELELLRAKWYKKELSIFVEHKANLNKQEDEAARIIAELTRCGITVRRILPPEHRTEKDNEPLPSVIDITKRAPYVKYLKNDAEIEKIIEELDFENDSVSETETLDEDSLSGFIVPDNASISRDSVSESLDDALPTENYNNYEYLEDSLSESSSAGSSTLTAPSEYSYGDPTYRPDTLEIDGNQSENSNRRRTRSMAAKEREPPKIVNITKYIEKNTKQMGEIIDQILRETSQNDDIADYSEEDDESDQKRARYNEVTLQDTSY